MMHAAMVNTASVLGLEAASPDASITLAEQLLPIARCPGCRGRRCCVPRPNTQKYHLAASPSASTVSRLGSVSTWRAR